MAIITFPVLIRSITRRLQLSFIKQEFLWNKLIGLDTVKRKLLLLKKINGRTICSIIDLKEVISCSVKKTYQSIGAGTLEKNKLEDFISVISLQLGLRGIKEPLSIIFYDTKFHNKTAVYNWEKKATAWQKQSLACW